jgi:hypothetical protein
VPLGTGTLNGILAQWIAPRGIPWPLRHQPGERPQFLDQGPAAGSLAAVLLDGGVTLDRRCRDAGQLSI